MKPSAQVDSPFLSMYFLHPPCVEESIWCKEGSAGWLQEVHSQVLPQAELSSSHARSIRVNGFSVLTDGDIVDPDGCLISVTSRAPSHWPSKTRP
ncbi:uncharacterized [Tachysurus ichikawai]